MKDDEKPKDLGQPQETKKKKVFVGSIVKIVSVNIATPVYAGSTVTAACTVTLLGGDGCAPLDPITVFSTYGCGC